MRGGVEWSRDEGRGIERKRGQCRRREKRKVTESRKEERREEPLIIWSVCQKRGVEDR